MSRSTEELATSEPKRLVMPRSASPEAGGAAGSAPSGRVSSVGVAGTVGRLRQRGRGSSGRTVQEVGCDLDSMVILPETMSALRASTLVFSSAGTLVSKSWY